mmetsp:Transcript_124043/g.214746  ORF Transcript_124043/g.214746 Transcript_124043/m.214746 type:complete len:386 (+) Transcript_124043:569-1726(+)
MHQAIAFIDAAGLDIFVVTLHILAKCLLRIRYPRHCVRTHHSSAICRMRAASLPISGINALPIPTVDLVSIHPLYVLWQRALHRMTHTSSDTTLARVCLTAIPIVAEDFRSIEAGQVARIAFEHAARAFSPGARVKVLHAALQTVAIEHLYPILKHITSWWNKLVACLLLMAAMVQILYVTAESLAVKILNVGLWQIAVGAREGFATGFQSTAYQPIGVRACGIVALNLWRICPQHVIGWTDVRGAHALDVATVLDIQYCARLVAAVDDLMVNLENVLIWAVHLAALGHGLTAGLPICVQTCPSVAEELVTPVDETIRALESEAVPFLRAALGDRRLGAVGIVAQDVCSIMPLREWVITRHDRTPPTQHRTGLQILQSAGLVQTM